MKPALFQFILFVVITVALAACDPASDFAASDLASSGGASVPAASSSAPGRPAPSEDARMSEAFELSAPASCPCFNVASLTGDDGALSGEAGGSTDYYLYFDVFGYYSLDPRRTEARAIVSTPAGLLEEVAAVYITYGNGPDDLHLICHRQEVVRHVVTGEPSYRYQTIEPSVEEAEACRRSIAVAAGAQESCQGAACDIPYSKEQLSPDYPAYGDEGLRAPETLLDAMKQKVDAVSRMLQLPV